MRDRDIDLNSDEPPSEKPTPAEAPKSVTARVVTPASAAPATNVTEAHGSLLKDLDAVRRAAQLVTDRIEALDAKLQAREASVAKQEQMLERAARETFAEVSREWAATAERYRKLADEVSSLNAWQAERVKKATGPWRIVAWTILGGLLSGLLVIWIAGSIGSKLRETIVGPPSDAAATTAPAEQPGAKKGKTTR